MKTTEKNKCSLYFAAFLLFSQLFISQDFTICIQPPRLDLRDVASGPDAIGTVTIRNPGDKAVEIVDVRRGCNCLRAELSARRLAPGQSADLKLVLRTIGLSEGQRVWKTYVDYKIEGKMLEAEVVVTAQLRTALFVEPSTLAFLGDRPQSREIVVEDRRPNPARVVSVRSSDTSVDATVTQKSDRSIVTVRWLPEKLGDDRKNVILQLSTSDPACPTLEIPVSVAKANEPAVTASPSKIVADANGSRLVRLRSSANRGLRIAKAACESPNVSCSWANSEESGPLLRVRFTGAVPRSPAPVRVWFEDARVPVLEIPIVASEF